MDVIRTVLVVIHAGAGIAGLVTGIASFALPRGGDGRSWVRWVYLVCIAIMFVTLIALVVLDWEGLDTTARVAFTALTGLAAVMMLRDRPGGPRGFLARAGVGGSLHRPCLLHVPPPGASTAPRDAAVSAAGGPKKPGAGPGRRDLAEEAAPLLG
jgi:hypothetical protein